MKRLELIYHIRNISVLYQDGTIDWSDAEFTSSDNFSATLKIWKDKVEPEQILQSWKELEERCATFITAMKYLGNRQIICSKPEFPTYYYEDKVFTPRNEVEARILIQYLCGEISSFAVMCATLPALEVSGHITISPSPLPIRMPFIPLSLSRLAATLTLVDELVNFPDLQLKMAFMILEELVSDQQVQGFKDIRNARNFVSHAVCRGKEVLDLLRTSLPSAINPSGAYAKFDRGVDEHQAFAASFANKARQWAREEFEREVLRIGGCIA